MPLIPYFALRLPNVNANWSEIPKRAYLAHIRHLAGYARTSSCFDAGWNTQRCAERPNHLASRSYPACDHSLQALREPEQNCPTKREVYTHALEVPKACESQKRPLLRFSQATTPSVSFKMTIHHLQFCALKARIFAVEL